MKLQLPRRAIDSIPADYAIVAVFEPNGTVHCGVHKKTTLPSLTTIEDLNLVQKCIDRMEGPYRARISFESQLDVKIKHRLETTNSKYIQVVRYLDDLLENAIVRNDIEKCLKLLIEGELQALCVWLNQTRSDPDRVYKPIFSWVLSLCAGVNRTQVREFEPSNFDNPKLWFFLKGSDELRSLYDLHPVLADAYKPYIWLYTSQAKSLTDLKVIFPPMQISLYKLRENVYSGLSDEEKQCLASLQFFLPFQDKTSNEYKTINESRKRILEQNKISAAKFQTLTLYQVVQSYRDVGGPNDQYQENIVIHVTAEHVAQFSPEIKSDYIPDYEGQIVPPPPLKCDVVYRHENLMNHPVFTELYRIDKIRLFDWCRRMQSTKIAFYLTDIVDARLQKEKLLSSTLRSGGVFEDNSGHP